MTVTAAALRQRNSAIEALVKIEIEFARIRDALYIERVGEVVAERESIENGTHAQMAFWTDLLEKRRQAKLDSADKWLRAERSLCEVDLESDERALWSHWAVRFRFHFILAELIGLVCVQHEKATLRSDSLKNVNKRRRLLDRDKRSIDRPKDGELFCTSCDVPYTCSIDRLAAIMGSHMDRRQYQLALQTQGIPYDDQELAYAFRKQAVAREAVDGLVPLHPLIVQSDLEDMGVSLLSYRAMG